MGTEVQVSNIVNEILRVETLEEGLSCFLVQRPETDRIGILRDELRSMLSGLTEEQQETGIGQYLLHAAAMTNTSRLQLLLSILHDLVRQNALPAWSVCRSIILCPKLDYTNSEFWVECFNLMRKIMGGVSYKEVREIIKFCLEKVQTIPSKLNAAILPQLKTLESVMEYAFDRNSCLLPAYLVMNELSKKEIVAHWKLATLISNYVESFRPAAQMLSIVGHWKLLPVVLHMGLLDQRTNHWKLDTATLKLPIKGLLPYDKNLLEPQGAFLRHILAQPHSRDMVCGILGLCRGQKQHCPVLEVQLVELVVSAMERAENEGQAEEPSMWLHVSCQLIFFITGQYADFNNIVIALHDKLAGRDLRRGRDHLMWVMLQYISGAITKNPLVMFLGILKLYDLMYPEKEPLPVPDINNPMCTHQMAACCIWLHLFKKAQSEHTSLHRPLPHALKGHHDFIQHLLPVQSALNMGCDYRLAILCNAYSTNTEIFNRPMSALVDSINKQTGMASSSLPGGASMPLAMCMLDAMTVHCKMSFIHNIVTHIIKAAQSKSNIPLPPALVETYSRLLVYTDIEALGVKGFIGHVLPPVFKSHAWGILYTLLEISSYRMHHIQPHYRVALLSHLHNLAAVPQTNQTQLHLCVESTALRLITGLGSAEVQPELTRFLNEPKMLVSAESEELNRALVLTLARSMHITGTGNDTGQAVWCKDILNTIMQNTPHTWANHTLEYFPPVLREFFQQNPVPVENKNQLKKAVEEEYRNWASMNNENDIITHFSVSNTPPLFLCLLWKVILETDRISPIAYKILERIGARALSTHLRKFCEYLVNEFSASTISGMQQQHVKKCVEAVDLMIWKYNILTIDRLVLCLSMRPHEGQMCFYIIQLLLLKSSEFRIRVQDFVRENSPEHWKQSNWYEKHVNFHLRYPENFAPEGTVEQTGGSATLPVYFGNVCLRFLPVFDNLIHRYLEMPPVNKSLESLLEHLGCLYKFHDRPVTYLYNTLHYYEQKVRERATLKRRLVLAVLGSLQESKVPDWGLSEQYQQYMVEREEKIWNPDLEYYMGLIRRIVDTMSGKVQFFTDWRFNEFPNPASHVLYVTCVELMALPLSPHNIGSNLLDVVMKGYTVIPPDQMMNWVNAVGLVMAALPNSYWQALQDRLVSVLSCPQLLKWTYRNTPFQMFNFQETHNSMLENKFSYALALAHSVWHHAGKGQLTTLAQFSREKLRPVIKTEEQVIFLYHLMGPFIQRLHSDGSNFLDIALELYEYLALADQHVAHLNYMDPLCDVLYHLKYMTVGDSLKSEALAIIRRLRPALQMRLRFIVQLSVEEIKAGSKISGENY